MRLLWTPELATGIRQIDLQHQELLEIINEFETAHEAGEDARAMDELLPRLAGYVVFHFATEESMLQGISGAAEHKALHIAQHKAFAENFMKFKAMPGHDQRSETTALLEYLKEWLLNHIMKTDMQLTRLLLVKDPGLA